MFSADLLQNLIINNLIYLSAFFMNSPGYLTSKKMEAIFII